MQYPRLDVTPIKEIIFTISHSEIVNSKCFEKFIELPQIKSRFADQVPAFSNSIKLSLSGKASSETKMSGYRLRGTNELVQLRMGSFSYHFLNSYCDYHDMATRIVDLWDALNDVAKEKLTVTSVSVRYINELEIDKDNPESRLIQLYPKQSSDRNISGFQNLVAFAYKDMPKFQVMIASIKPNDDKVLLDITVTNAFDPHDGPPPVMKDSFTDLQEVKNRAFYDSITARALIRYIKPTKHEHIT